MTALTKQELLDIDPCYTKYAAYEVAIRHAWNAAIAAEFNTVPEAAKKHAAVSQAWSSIAKSLKGAHGL